MFNYPNRAHTIIERVNELAGFTETAGIITRTYGSNPFVAAGNQIARWMKDAGLSTYIDNVHNIRGRLECSNPGAPVLLLASHYDSVINAGKFDGPLGILMGLDIIHRLASSKAQLPFHIELIAFCDEEGVRFHTTYLGSRVAAGSFDPQLLHKKDKEGISLLECIRQMGGQPELLRNDSFDGRTVLGYIELHIEQGPVLYQSGIPVAAVSAIAGQQRIALSFTGAAGHAGTVPMQMRQDALCAAAASVLAIEAFAAIEKNSVVATVGKLDIPNAASNVIPGDVGCTLDLRSADATALAKAGIALKAELQALCNKRNIGFNWEIVQQTDPVACDPLLNNLLQKAITAAGIDNVTLVSGAGHDAVPLSAICPVCMLFIRCFKGISHNPLESVETKDIAAALRVADNFLLNLTNHFKNE